MILRRSGFYLVITNNIEFLFFYLVIISFGLKKVQFEHMILPQRPVYSAVKRVQFFVQLYDGKQFCFSGERKKICLVFYIFYVVVKKMLLLSADIYGLWIILEKKFPNLNQYWMEQIQYSLIFFPSTLIFHLYFLFSFNIDNTHTHLWTL